MRTSVEAVAELAELRAVLLNEHQGRQRTGLDPEVGDRLAPAGRWFPPYGREPRFP